MSAAAGRLDLSLIQVRILRGRLVALVFCAGLAGSVFVLKPSWRAASLCVLAGLAISQGWRRAPSGRQVEVMLACDLLGTVVVWYLAREVAGIAFLTVLVAAVGVFLVPPGRVSRLLVLAVAAEGLRVVVYLFGVSFPVVGGPEVEPIRVDFFIGVAARVAVTVWAVSGLGRLLTRFDRLG